MWAKTRLLCTTAICCFLTSVACGQQSIQWQPTLDAAKRVAGQTNRLVLLHFWSPSCEPCRRMERDVFPRADVAAAVERSYVAVKLNADHFPATARQYGVSALPTDVVITPQGQLVEKSVGSLGAEKYAAILSRIATSNRQNSLSEPTGPLAAGSKTAMQTWPTQASALPGGYPNHPHAGAQGGLAGTAQPAPVSPSYAVQAAIPGTSQSQLNGNASSSSTYTQSRAGQIGMSPNSLPQPDLRTGPTSGAGSPGFAVGGLETRQFDAAVPPFTGQQPTAPSTQQTFGWPPLAGQPGSAAAGLARGSASPSSAPTAVAQAGPQRQENSVQPSVSGPAGSQAPPQVAAGNPPLALDGYCPVQLSEKERWVKGSPRWGLIHEGRTYLFAGPEEQSRFYADPARYAPAYSGSDIVLAVERGQDIAGHREHGAWFDGRVYLFSNEESYSRFSADPYRYLQAVQQTATSGARNSDMANGHSANRY